MSNVTPIRSGGGNGSSSTGTPKKKRPARRPKAGLLLFESDEFDGFTTQDVVTALHGVCVALDHLVVDYVCRISSVEDQAISSVGDQPIS